MYQDILEFKGQWRNYQQRVLDRFNEYKSDNKVHIVAAPGSGKTTVGIELIKRFNQKALVLVPTITIRQQWISRIEEAFLKEGIDSSLYLSNDIKNMKYITVSTYQSLHSAMTKYKGIESEENGEYVRNEEVDFTDFNLIEQCQKHHIQTLCLDECHHLRNEWWKALEDFKKELHYSYTIALTATPPFDSSVSLWNRYISMCGDIDEEITVAELVKEGSLCPHQDFVYFNYPTQKERQQIKEFVGYANECMHTIMKDPQFEKMILSYKYLNDSSHLDKSLDNPKYLSSILIYLNSKGKKIPEFYKEVLGYSKLESMNLKWMEALLQGVLYDDVDSYSIDDHYHKELMSYVKSLGLIEKRVVSLQKNTKLEQQIVKSVGKCDSIKDIVFHEYKQLNNKLKLLILTDYIRKEYEKNIGDDKEFIPQLGVLPFFEMLRKEAKIKHVPINIGVLCGTMIIIPAKAINRLNELYDENIKYKQVGHLSSDEYVEVQVSSQSHELISCVSKLFEEGYFEVLIGTKSLLGEGWDSPCVNTLILASFVGSFMLSNQMRGRAIRTYKNHPNKASHIYHLVCLNPELPQDSLDLQTLNRRMEHFLGLHYTLDTIENGIDRLTAIQYPLTKSNVEKTNKLMLEQASHRSTLKARWDSSLAIYNDLEVVEEVKVSKDLVVGVLLNDAIRLMLFCVVIMIIEFIATLAMSGVFAIPAPVIILFTITVFIPFIIGLKNFFKFKSPLARLEYFGKCIYKSLSQTNLLDSIHSRICVESDMNLHSIYLKGGTQRDNALFAKCVSEFFDEIDNQRYILYNPKKRHTMEGYFVVPEIFSKRKEDAMLFVENAKKFIGPYQLIYTRNPQGRKILLEGRIHALANKETRFIKHQKVKGNLE